MSTQLREGSIESDSDGTNILQHHLLYTNKDLKNYPFINIGTSIPIVKWKVTNNLSHIIRDGLLFGYSLYSGNNQRSKLDVELLSIPTNHIELFCYLNKRLLFTGKITRPDVLDCVTYVLIMK